MERASLATSEAFRCSIPILYLFVSPHITTVFSYLLQAPPKDNGSSKQLLICSQFCYLPWVQLGSFTSYISWWSFLWLHSAGRLAGGWPQLGRLSIPPGGLFTWPLQQNTGLLKRGVRVCQSTKASRSCQGFLCFRPEMAQHTLLHSIVKSSLEPAPIQGGDSTKSQIP